MLSFILFKNDVRNRLDRVLLWVSGVSFTFWYVFGLHHAASRRGNRHNEFILSHVPKSLHDEVFWFTTVTILIFMVSFLWLGIRVMARLAGRSFSSQTLHMMGKVLLYIFLPSAVVAVMLILGYWIAASL